MSTWRWTGLLLGIEIANNSRDNLHNSSTATIPHSNKSQQTAQLHREYELLCRSFGSRVRRTMLCRCRACVCTSVERVPQLDDRSSFVQYSRCDFIIGWNGFDVVICCHLKWNECECKLFRAYFSIRTYSIKWKINGESGPDIYDARMRNAMRLCIRGGVRQKSPGDVSCFICSMLATRCSPTAVAAIAAVPMQRTKSTRNDPSSKSMRNFQWQVERFTHGICTSNVCVF